MPKRSVDRAERAAAVRFYALMTGLVALTCAVVWAGWYSPWAEADRQVKVAALDAPVRAASPAADALVDGQPGTDGAAVGAQVAGTDGPTETAPSARPGRARGDAGARDRDATPIASPDRGGTAPAVRRGDTADRGGDAWRPPQGAWVPGPSASPSRDVQTHPAPDAD